jgi:hypothetical protein
MSSEVKFLKQLVVALLCVSLSSCVVISQRVDVKRVNTRAPVTVRGAVKAHLNDGTMVVYPHGVEVTADALVGPGTRWDLTRTVASLVERVPLSELLGMESYRTGVKPGETVLASTLASVAGFFGGVALTIAIFGSCPTVYSADGSVEEAELFSSSIAPLFEGRDIDRLQARPDAGGWISLDIRNEAMETHYINHLQLVEVTHGAHERVVPDQHGAPVAVANLRPASTAVNRDGHDISAVLKSADEAFYVSDRARLESATAADMDDWIDVSIPIERGAKEAALVFRMRNSLLNTILLYDVMLGSSGAAALDWLENGLSTISTAVELGRWHQRRAGMHISVWQNGRYQEVVRVPDSGPISWHDVAAIIPVPADSDDTLRVRLSFLTDHWRIDELAVSTASRHPVPRTIPIQVASGYDGKADAVALANLQSPDDAYLQTNPGDSFLARFNTGPGSNAGERTFLLSSQGYYTEWIRGSWIREATETNAFLPSDAAVLTAMRKWADTRDSFTQRFTRARVPVKKAHQ